MPSPLTIALVVCSLATCSLAACSYESSIDRESDRTPRRDAWPTIADGKPSPHEEILLNAAPASGAILVGQWKLVIHGSTVTADAQALPAKRRAKGRSSQELVELFDLAEDPYEKENVAATHPDKVRELRARYEAFAREAVPPKTRPKPPGFQSPKVWGENP